MSLIEDAKQIEREGPPEHEGVWLCCLSLVSVNLHSGYCPWRSLPQIVAVIEAAERVVKAWQADTGTNPIPGSYGGVAIDFDRGIAYQREKQEAEQALVAALKGESPITPATAP